MAKGAGQRYKVVPFKGAVLHPVRVRPPLSQCRTRAGKAALLEAGKELDVAVKQPNRLKVWRRPLEEVGADRVDNLATWRQPDAVAVEVHPEHTPAIEAE
eukprot:580437-Prymnesium_polylepis.1